MSEPTALALLTEAEKAAVLDELIFRDVELERRAEQVGRQLLATVAPDHVASAVAAQLLAFDQDDLAAHAGPTRFGYVEPTEAVVAPRKGDRTIDRRPHAQSTPRTRRGGP